MKKSKIEWCDSTFNPVTGCLHDCRYCYARSIANRFGGASETHYNECVGTEMQWETEDTGELHVLEEPIYDPDGGKNAPYPYYFDPTLLKYRLGIPQKWSKARNIFVCSMADLFGDWIPDEWIEEVMKACAAAPQHNYLFLTKNPERYCDLLNKGLLLSAPNMWYGSTATSSKMKRFVKPKNDSTQFNTFISIEPLLEKWDINPYGEFEDTQWVIIGAESGNHKSKVIPQKEWINEIVDQCDKTRTPVFMKDSLVPIIGEENMRCDFPKNIRR